MQSGRILIALTLGAGVVGVSALGPQRANRAGQREETQQVPMPTRGVTLELAFGQTDRQPMVWDGQIAVSPGEVCYLEPGQPGSIQIVGNSWRLGTRPLPKATANPKRTSARAVRLYVTLQGPPAARVEVTTRQGDFNFALGELRYGRIKRFLGGAVAVTRLPLTRQLTGTPEEEDFPAAARAPDGTVWCAYLSYQHGTPIVLEELNRGNFDSLVTRHNGDQIKLVGFSDGRWSAPFDVTEPRLDLWRPAVAVDGQGIVYVVWPQNRQGNWDLFARTYDPQEGKLGEVRRLTTAPGADFGVVASGDGKQTGVWLAWQGWRDGNYDVWLAHLQSSGAIQPHRVSTSPRNDWNPSVALAGGAVWVAWDTYDKGDYDVYLRRLAGGKFDAPVPVAVSSRFEARPSVVGDQRGRLWVAYEDAAANWGKDYGDRWKGKSGVPFYLERNIIVRCLNRGKLEQTAVDFRSDLIESWYDDPRKRREPTETRHRISMPRLGVDQSGRVWLLCRRHPQITAGGERWVSYATWYEGERWAEQIQLPQSENLLDNRPALVPLDDGGMLVIHSTDRRQRNVRDAQNNDLYATALHVNGTAQAPVLVTARPGGKQHILVHPNEGEEIKRIHSYRITAGGKTYRLLRGEFHRHTEISSHRDWDGPMEEIWRYGLDVAQMDWIGPGDHDYGVGLEYIWWLTQKQIDIHHHPPTFVPMFTYERSVQYPSGHRNVMFARRGIRTLPRLNGRQSLYGTAEEGAPDIKNLYAYLKHFGGICSSHTSATNMGTDWRDNDSEVEPVVEIFQGHRQNYEETRAPLAARDAEDTIQGYRPAGFVWNALAKGHRLGFQASSDHVSTHISYGIVLAEEATREGIIEAFRNRHSYAAHDNIVMDVRCGTHIMGDELTVRSMPKLDITVVGTAPLARMDIIRQVGLAMPVYAAAFQPQRQDFSMSWTDTAAEAGEVNMYYVRITQQDGKLAWASPLWIHYEPAE